MDTPKNAINQYHFTFTPEVEARSIRSILVYSKAEHLKATFVLDGMSNLMSMQEIGAERLSFTAIRKHDRANIEILLQKGRTIPYGSREMNRFYYTQMRRNLASIGMSLLGCT